MKHLYNESDLSKHLIESSEKVSDQVLCLLRVENDIGTGTPDTSYEIGYSRVRGWIELKIVNRRRGPAKIKSLKAWQKNWLKKHGKLAGYCWLLVCDLHTQTIFLFHSVQIDSLEGWGIEDWKSNSALHWKVHETELILSELSTVLSNG